MTSEKIKTFEGYLLLNIRNGKSRIVKNLPKKVLIAAEVAVHFKIDCVVPKPTIGEMVGEIKLTDTQFTDFVLSEIEDQNGK